ncbi:MAG TPA: hypothetical protein VM241_03970 [Candidatus Thermoplasmatota archaeon]|nr:hypothetical protein [Candidatus Thermoplasmatota archaeon]
MTSRSDLDTPATVIAAALGVAVILVALPFTIAAFPQTPKSYDAAWGERLLDSKTLPVTAEGRFTATVSARDVQPASIKVETTACADTFNPQFQQQAANLHVKLSSGSTLLKEIDMKCPGEGFTVKLGDHADVASAQASNPETAKRIVWLDASATNATGALSYTLEVVASRTASPLQQIPITPATTLAASLRVSLSGWDVTMNEHQKEVAK